MQVVVQRKIKLMNSVFIVGYFPEYSSMFINNGWSVKATPEEANFLQFCGGADVHPSLYGEEVHPTTGFSIERDQREVELFNKFVGQKNLLGICRGSQFLTVMSGGRLWQNVTDHALHYTHKILDIKTNSYIDVSSTHHQMMRTEGMTNVEHVAIAMFECRKESDKEVKEELYGEEVNFFPETKALCFQPHPEFFGKEHPCQKYYFECVQRYFSP